MNCFCNLLSYTLSNVLFCFSQKYTFFGKAWRKRPKKAPMASKNPRNGSDMLKNFEIFDFHHKIIQQKKSVPHKYKNQAAWSLKQGSMLKPNFKALTWGYFWGKKTKDLFAKQSCHIHLNENWPLSVKGVYRLWFWS